MRVVTLFIYSHTQNSTTTKLAKPPTKLLAGIDFSEYNDMVLGFQKVCQKILFILKSKQDKMEEEFGEKSLPRVTKLSRKYNLSEKEGLAFIYAMCSAVCQEGVRDT